MLNKFLQNIALIYIMTGIFGIAGAIEHGTGLIPALILLASGTAVMYLQYKEQRKRKDKKTTTNNIAFGSSPAFPLDKHIQSKGNVSGKIVSDQVHRVLIQRTHRGRK